MVDYPVQKTVSDKNIEMVSGVKQKIGVSTVTGNDYLDFPSDTLEK